MKIAVINSCNYSSTGTICHNTANILRKQGHDVIFCYARGQKSDESFCYKFESMMEVRFHGIATRITGYEGCFSKPATERLIGFLNRFKPDLVILGELHGYYLAHYRFLSYLKEKKIKTLYFLFEEYAYTGKCGYTDPCLKYQVECKKCPKIKDYPKTWFFDRSSYFFKKKQETYSNFPSLFMNTVPYNYRKALGAALIKNTGVTLLQYGWGIDIKNKYKPNYEIDVINEYGIDTTKKVILSVAPLSDARKGIKKYYIPCAEAFKDDKRFVFVLVGVDCQHEAFPKNIIAIPYIKNQDKLCVLFTIADLFIIPSVADTYPTVCLISLGCGTPFIGFKCSGVQYMAPEPFGKYVELGNVDHLVELIKVTDKKSRSTIEQCRSYALANYDHESILKKIMDVITNNNYGDI